MKNLWLYIKSCLNSRGSGFYYCQIRLKQYHRQIFAFSLLFAAALLQSTLLNYFRIFNVKPDVLLASLILFTPFFNLRWLIIFALLGGAYRDIFSILPFSFNVIICILWVILAKQLSYRLSIENAFIRSTMLALIILLNSLSWQFFLFILDKPIPIGYFLRIIPIEIIFTLLLSFPMYRFFMHCFRQ